MALPAVNATDSQPGSGALMLQKNSTVPPAALGLTVAVKVTCWLVCDGFADDVRVVPVSRERRVVTSSARLQSRNAAPTVGFVYSGRTSRATVPGLEFWSTN